MAAQIEAMKQSANGEQRMANGDEQLADSRELRAVCRPRPCGELVERCGQLVAERRVGRLVLCKHGLPFAGPIPRLNAIDGLRQASRSH